MTVEFTTNSLGQIIPLIKSRALCSRVAPMAEAQAWVDHYSEVIRWADQVVVLGLGAGYHLETLLMAFPEKSFIVVEPLEIISASCRERYFNNSRVRIVSHLAVPSGRSVILPFRPSFVADPELYQETLLQLTEARSGHVDFAFLQGKAEIRADSIEGKINFVIRELIK